jgi:hypothetical protein
MHSASCHLAAFISIFHQAVQNLAELQSTVGQLLQQAEAAATAARAFAMDNQ